MSNADFWWQKFLQDAGITWEIGPSHSTDANGHLYWTLGMEGVKEQGSQWKLMATAEEFAQQFYLKALLENLMDNKHIVWRRTPTIEGRGTDALYTVYSRLTSYPRKPT